MKKNLNTSKELLIIVLIIIFLTSSVSSSAFATGDGIGSFDNKDEENTNTTSVKNSNLSDNESAPFNNNGLLDVDDAIDKDELVEDGDDNVEEDVPIVNGESSMDGEFNDIDSKTKEELELPGKLATFYASPKYSAPSSRSGGIESRATSPNGKLIFMKVPIPYSFGGETNLWDYTEYDGDYDYEIQIVYDPSLAAGMLREVVIDVDPFDVGESSLFDVATVASKGDFINNVTISEDRKLITYIIENDELIGASGTLTFSLMQSDYFAPNNGVGKLTTHYKSAGTLASNIGVMLLENPNARVGVELKEGTEPNKSILLEHELRRDNHNELPLLKEAFVTSNGSTKLEEGSLQELYLGSDGHLYFSDDKGMTMKVKTGSDTTNEEELVPAPINFYRMNYVNEDHAPIGDPSVKFDIPNGFDIYEYDSIGEFYKSYTSVSWSLNSVKDNESINMGINANSPSTSQDSFYTHFSNLIESSKELQQMFSGVVPTEYVQAYSAVKITGNSETSIRANNHLYTYTDDYYNGDDTTFKYNQVYYDEAEATYKVENKSEPLPGMKITVPEYEYTDLIRMESSTPEKVNDSDPDGTKYRFSIFNNVTSFIDSEGQKRYTNENVKNNIAPYFHNDGTMTMELTDENLDATDLFLYNQYNEFTGYTIYYGDAGNLIESEKVNVLGNINISLAPQNGKKVNKIVFNISKNGLVETDRASGYETSGYFLGEFKEPEGDNKVIKIDVDFESKGNGPESLLENAKVIAEKEITWEYEDTVDSVHVYQDIVDEEELLINGKGRYDQATITTGVAVPMEVDQSSNSYRNFRINLFDKTYIDDLAVDNETKEKMKNDVDAALSQLGEGFKFMGYSSMAIYQESPEDKVWIEYTTNKKTEPQKYELTIGKSVTDNNKEKYLPNLGAEEYFTSMYFCSDYLKILGADDNHLDTDFDVVEILTDFEFDEKRLESNPKADNGTVVEIRAKATADGLGNSWTPAPKEDGSTNLQPEQSKNKTLSDNYGDGESDIKLYYEAVAQVVTDYSTFEKPPEIEMEKDTIAAGTTFDENSLSYVKEIEVDLPVLSGVNRDMYNSNVYYPEGTYAYFQVNSKVFKYVGKYHNVKVAKHEGATWLVYDLSGIDLRAEGSGSLSFDASDFAASTHVLPNSKEPLFLDSYVDMATLFVASPNVDPYIRYIPTENFKTYGEKNPYNLTKLSNINYDEARFVKINTDKLVTINTSSSTNIQLFPGIDEKVNGFGSVEYNAYDFKNLNLSLDINSVNRNYKNYHLVIEIPREKEKYQNPSMAEEVESNISLYLRDLEETSVLLTGDIDEKDYKVIFASNYKLDETDTVNSTIEYDVAKNIEEAKFVIVSIDSIKDNSYINVEVPLMATEDAMYDSGHQYKSYASAEARYEYTDQDITDTNITYNVAAAYASQPAEYIFEWYKLKGKVFEDYSAYGYFDGLNAGGDRNFSHQDHIDFINLNNLNESGEPEELKAPQEGYGNWAEYELLLQPKEVAEGEVSYELAVDLDKLTAGEYHEPVLNISYIPAINTSEFNYGNWPTFNNNAPMEGGIKLIANHEKFEVVSITEEGIPHATEDEVVEGFVDFGVYKNPTVSITPTVVEVKVGESIEFEAEIEGYGTFVNNKVYEPIDQSEYATTTATITNNEKVADIELIGEEVTFDGNTGTYIYKDATTTLVNYFGNEVTVTNKYLVYSDPFATFHDHPIDNQEVVGSWHDDSIDMDRVNAALNLGHRDDTEGTVNKSQVPGISPPKGYLFLGWETKDKVKVPFEENLTTLVNYEQLYPIFEPDMIGGKTPDGEDVGDEIPDIYQMKYVYVAANPEDVNVNNTKYPGKQVTETLNRIDGGGEYSETAPTSPTGTGFTVTTDETYHKVGGWKFYYLDNGEKVYIEDPAGGELFEESADGIKNHSFDSPGVIYIEVQNTTHAYKVKYTITNTEGTIIDNKLTSFVEPVAIMDFSKGTPEVHPASGFEFKGWYVYGNPNKTLVTPTSFQVTNDHLHFHALLIPIDNAGGVPYTGDDTNILLAVTVLIFSMLCLIWICIRGGRQPN